MSDAFLFWFIAAVMTALALAFALPRLLARHASASRAPRAATRAATNLAIFRSELAVLARERAEGRLTDDQHAQAREEIERRLLADVAADDADRPRVAPPRSVAIVLALGLPALAFGLYALFGNPAAIERVATTTGAPGDNRGVADSRRDELVRHLARNPRDGRGWVLLARIDFEADRFDEATASFRKAVASPKVAADAGVLCEYADALGMSQGGSLAGQPRELVMRALALDPTHPKALEMAGSAAYEQQEFAAAARYWRQLLAQFPERSVQHRELASAIQRAERLAAAEAAGRGKSP